VIYLTRGVTLLQDLQCGIGARAAPPPRFHRPLITKIDAMTIPAKTKSNTTIHASHDHIPPSIIPSISIMPSSSVGAIRFDPFVCLLSAAARAA
jgi:hypothetical protein